MSRVIPTRIHGLLDLLTPPSLLAVPALLRLEGGPAALAPRVVGGTAAVYSLLTDYETAPKKLIPMPVHLALDAVSGAALAAVPWLSGDARRGTRYWLPHAVAGGTEVALALLTQTTPSYKRRRGLARLLGR